MWQTDPPDAWHALFVPTGREEITKKALEKYLGDQLIFMVPKRELRERKAGKWLQVKRNLFPGYILLKGPVTVDIYYMIKKIPVLTRLLKNEQGPQRIEENELEVLKMLINGETGTVGISTAYRENEMVQIVAGPLVGLEGRIQGIDARKGRARVRINFMGEPRTLQLGIDLIDRV